MARNDWPISLRFQAAGGVNVDRHHDVAAFLPDHGFEQALLAAEPGIDRRLRAADHADDLVDRDVVVALLEKERPDRASDALAALLGGLGAAGTAQAAAGTPARQGLSFLNRHRIPRPPRIGGHA
jgi:hypothetical protein